MWIERGLLGVVAVTSGRPLTFRITRNEVTLLILAGDLIAIQEFMVVRGIIVFNAAFTKSRIVTVNQFSFANVHSIPNTVCLLSKYIISLLPRTWRPRQLVHMVSIVCTRGSGPILSIAHFVTFYRRKAHLTGLQESVGLPRSLNLSRAPSRVYTKPPLHGLRCKLGLLFVATATMRRSHSSTILGADI